MQHTSGFSVAAPFVPLVVIGVVLVCAGLWNIGRTSVAGLMVDGVAVIVTGIWNVVAWLWIEDGRPTRLVQCAIAGLVQIVWGVQRLATYRTARFAANDPQAIAHLESIVRGLAKRDARSVAGEMPAAHVERFERWKLGQSRPRPIAA